MLAKKNRLTVSNLKNVGRFSLYRTDLFDAKMITDFDSRYAVIIGAKTFKKAVERNKVKRCFYRILQSKVVGNSELYTQSGVLFYPKKQTLTSPYPLLEKAILSYLKK